MNEVNVKEKDKFFNNGIATVAVKDWLDWASGKPNTSNSVRIVLPMIQRGSVWKPHQVMDLWDTLLRGMPMGSMLASRVVKGEKYFTPITRELKELPDNGGLSLLDGQQRTLSMLLAWPAVGNSMNRRIWVDLGEEDKNDHIFRFHFTSINHPFGFQLAGNSGSPVNKLSLSERRSAYEAYEYLICNNHNTSDQSNRQSTLWDSEDVLPWHGILPINLQKIIGFQIERGDFKIEIKKCIEEVKNCYNKIIVNNSNNNVIKYYKNKLDKINKIPDERIHQLANAVNLFMKQYMPIIEVPETVFTDESHVDDKDPALAVLFQRIGTGGTALSNADYVFSVIKHHSPECHTLVENLLSDKRISALFTPVSLVSTAVRLTAAELNMPDYVKIEKSQFGGFLKKNKANNESFLPSFEKMVDKDGKFAKILKSLLERISYIEKEKDIGLPKHALCLINIPILEVVLRWLHAQNVSDVNGIIDKNRNSIIRFLIYCALAVKKEYVPKSSTILFKKIKTTTPQGDFPENEFIDCLKNANLSYPIFPPKYYKEKLNEVIYSGGSIKKLRSWGRFDVSGKTDEEKIPIELYQRFWNKKNLLLWLQREYVFHNFEENPALASAGDETPYDFDHISPQSHWANWKGSKNQEGYRIIDFVEDNYAVTLLGNSIGNFRVWSNIMNRRDGDASPMSKLELSPGGDRSKSDVLLKESLIRSDESVEQWVNCSSSTDKTDPRHWSSDRARAFQSAIENRVFHLYQLFYNDLNFYELEPQKMN